MTEHTRTPAQQDLDVRETYTKKSEFAPNVTLAEETFFGHGWQPLTISFLQALWFLPHGAPFDVPSLVAWFERIGWKGANGKPLGANVVRRELGLLREAGYVRARRLRGDGGKAVGIQYVVSQRRMDQPETGAWIPAPEENRRSDHMSPMATRGESPHVVNGAKAQVGPRGTNELSPPTPPGGGGFLLPLPPHAYLGPVPSQREEGREFCPEETEAAQEFLQQMTQWQAGLSTARKCAPRLLRAMRTQDWPPITDLDDAQRLALEAEIFKNTSGAKAWVKCLPGWVDDLRRYRKPAPAEAAAAEGATAQDLAALRAACPACDQYGWIVDDDDDGPMRRCAHPDVTAAAAKGDRR
ncbi:hypothetical protein [Streptomyces sp. MS2.AVA.5]|uniref:Uncharacterized protein n=1 Tax=Streptomyces achmelvichensis TaxID=3134111 RepID=A0ACC6PM91_9ACTN